VDIEKVKYMQQNNYEGQLMSTPYPKSDPYGTLSMPIYNTLAYEFATAEEMEKVFTGKEDKHFYSRISNPTVEYFENRVKNIVKAHGVTAFNSGMAAISNAFFTLAWSGSNIVTTSLLFGNTYSFFVSTLKAFGIEIRFCDLTNAEETAACIDENTCAVFAEVIANPQMEVVDLQMLSDVAHKKNVPFVADTTLVPFTVFRAADFGIDIEIVASTKYISGGATSLGGLIIDYGTFDWAHSSKLKSVPTESENAFNFKLRKEVQRNLGAYMTPQSAYMQTLGLETLNIRFKRQAGTCLKLAEKLQSLPEVKCVNYTGLPDNPYYEISRKQFGELPGAMLTFDLESRERCFTFLNNLKLIRRSTNLFDNRSLIIHPASTIYGVFTPEQRVAMDVKDTTIRFSVGLESAEELFDDICQALNG
jgi:O-acetylhomoserine (thiol)-lyase